MKKLAQKIICFLFGHEYFPASTVISYDRCKVCGKIRLKDKY